MTVETYVFPVSFAQERLWFLDQLSPGQSIYNMYDIVRWPGRLSLPALDRALAALMERHETLRTRFAVEDGSPVQIVSTEMTVPLEVTDLTLLPPDEREATARALAVAEIARPFDLTQAPLLRVRVFRLAAEAQIVTIAVHHIVSDGWSMRILYRELGALYAAFADARAPSLAPLPIQYADYAVWQRALLTGPAIETQLDYWRERLAGAPPLLELPADRPRPALPSYRGALHEFALGEALSDRVRGFAQREGATPFMVLLAAFTLLLSRHAERDDIVVGTPIAHRTRVEVEGLIGFFANTLVLRTQIERARGFRDLVARVRETTLAAYAHQDVPFERLVETLRPDRALNHNPLFQVMFVLNAFDRGEGEADDGGFRETGIGHAKFDLHVSMVETGRRLRGVVEYATDLFDETTVARMARHYVTLIEAAIAEPDRAVGTLPLIDEPERARVLAASRSPWQPGARIPLIDMRDPERIAIVEGDHRSTYVTLDRRANALARRLVAAGVGTDVPVGIHLPRSIEQIVAVLAVLKAGGCYVPLDPAYPSQRLADACADSGLTIVVGEPPFAVGTVLHVDDAEADTPPPAAATTPDALAYILYTSGSTGRPKGVAMPHRVLANLIAWQVAIQHPATRVLHFTTLNFDVSAQEIFATLGAGATLVIASEEERRDSAALIRRLAEDRIERLFLPAAALQALALTHESGDWPTLALREIVTAGEQLQASPQLRRFVGGTGVAALRNQYGPTETHVASDHALAPPVDAWAELPPIGCAIAGARLYLLDPDGALVSDGIVGEIHIGGDILARGYLGRPAETATAFMPDPFADTPGARLYRTGDLARRLGDGTLEFLGRRDRQIKVRGVRVEPGEVEAVLRMAPELREVAVVDGADPAGGRRLIAHVVAIANAAIDAETLRRLCRAHLPEAMVPSLFVMSDGLPRTPSGKIDRAALPEPAARPTSGDDRGPTALEAALAAIWTEVLKAGAIGLHDNFFDLGGHSLLATRVAARIRQRLGVAMPLRMIFEAPTIADLAAAILDAEIDRDTPDAEEVRIAEHQTGALA